MLVDTAMLCLIVFSLLYLTLHFYKFDSSFKMQLKSHFLLEAFQDNLLATPVANSDSFPGPPDTIYNSIYNSILTT